MAEMNAALQQLLHIDNAQFYSSLFLPPPDSPRPARRYNGDKRAILRRVF
jgi:hypothetical protein